MDLSRVERNFLSRRPRPETRTPIRIAQIRCDRDQLDILWSPKRQELDWLEKEVPDDFQFALKGSRYCVTRPKLADTEEALGHYFAQGMDALGSKLGPILWMLAARRSFDREDIARFLNRLPTSLGGRPLQHAIEPRHESFRDAKFFGLCRDHDIAVVFGDDAKFPLFDVETASFAYARLQNMHEELANGYDPHDLDRFAEKARDWRKAGRNAFIFMINGAKIRAPAAALALQERLR